MFHSARIKLTAWYLLIIMLISVLFSVAFYQVATNEVERVINRIQFRHEHPNEDLPIRPPQSFSTSFPTLEELEESKKQLFSLLLLVNGGIFVVAGGAGYFLAGRTLRPIQIMIDEQNQFISSASHELRTPIATMRAEMEGSLLEKQISDKHARALITSNLEELGALQDLSNNLLKIAQIHNISTEKYMKKISLAEVIQTAQKKVSSLAKKKQISIDTNIKDVATKGDKSRLTEVFVILLDNAIKYSPQKTKIKITSVETQKSVKIYVSDNGMGISKRDLPHIFDRFYRADKSRSQAEGYGLGLSLAKIIVEKHNGSIAVESKEETGTTFAILLPLS